MKNNKFIPVAAPVFIGNEKKYVNDCLNSTWISSNGKYIEKFKEQFSLYTGVQHCLPTCNGTVALHLALLALGIQPGDEVIIPTVTFISTANAVTYCGAKPVFIDSDLSTWNIDPNKIEMKINNRTRGIIPVHLYGYPVDMDAILSIAERHNLFVLEDAAESHGAEYHGNRVGSLGNAAIFSFYGNKIITTGEGGMVVTNDDRIAKRVIQLNNQAMDPDKRYWFNEIGFNYRMTNIEAAIGLAQLENINWHISKRKEVFTWYQEYLGQLDYLTFQQELENTQHIDWMVSILVDSSVDIKRDNLMRELHNQNIDTRPLFYPMHILPPYQQNENIEDYPVANDITARGINLPTWSGLTKHDVEYICSVLIKIINNAGKS